MFIKINVFNPICLVFFFLYVFVSHVVAQDTHYIDKLFGTRFEFSPKETEICIKFSPTATDADMQSLIDAFALSDKYQNWKKIDFGVFILPAGVTRDSVVAQLIQSQKVSGVVPVYVDQEDNERYVDPELFTMQFNDGISESQAQGIIESWGSEIFKKQWTPGYYTITIPSGFTLFEAVRHVIEWPEVKFAEPVFYGFNDLLEDTYLDDSWHLKNTGQRTNYTVGSDINALSAWDITSGDPDVIIVLIDTGIEYNVLPSPHPDLAANVLPQGNEDWDFLDDADKLPDDESTNGHGTGVAGFASAVRNGIGVRGVAYSCRMMPLRALASSGMNQERADAINYAVSRVDEFDGMVINCSWKATGSITAITSAINNAVNNNVPVFAAAGNIGQSQKGFQHLRYTTRAFFNPMGKQLRTPIGSCCSRCPVIHHR